MAMSTSGVKLSGSQQLKRKFQQGIMASATEAISWRTHPL